MKTTKKVNNIRTLIFFQSEVFSLPVSLQTELNQLRKEGWSFNVIDQSRGFMRVSLKDETQREINIPHWILSEQHKKNGKFTWYVAHELAHAIHFRDEEKDFRTSLNKHHNQVFMQILKRICPVDCIHHELGYQSIEAEKAGIVHSASN